MQILKDEIRRRILAVASEEFRLKGFDGASMRGIAERVGISVSNLYAYFPSKEGIFEALSKDAHRAMNNFMKDIPGCMKEASDPRRAGSEAFEGLISERLIELLRVERTGILLILECAVGTKYSGTREAMVEAFAELFAQKIGACRESSSRESANAAFLMKVLAMNLVQGFVEITRQDASDEWMAQNIRSLVRYHKGGMDRFSY